MIDIDEYEKVFKEYPVSDYWPQMKRIQAHGMRSLNEIKRLRKELDLYKTRYLKMTEGMDWQEENEMWSDEE